MKNQPITRRVLLLTLGAALGAGLAACGRKGNLEAPPGADPNKSNVELPTQR